MVCVKHVQWFIALRREVQLLLLASMCVLCVAPDALWAQTMRSVSASQVDVHKQPTTSSPVIGQAMRGRSLEVTREVGDWVQVVWPAAPDRIGYVRVRLASNAVASLSEPRPATTMAMSNVATAAAPEPADVRLATREAASVTTPAALVEARATRLPNNGYQLPLHTLGFGARMDPFRTVGGSGRFWSAYGVGVQLDLSRSSQSSELAPGRLTTVAVSPGVLYPLPGVIGSSVWLRPYVGSGIDIARSSLSNVTPGVSLTDTSVGFKVFGGGEFTFAGAPQVGVSVDLGYRRLDSTFTGFDNNHLHLSLAGHWYIR
jgi:hypothetical protein